MQINEKSWNLSVRFSKHVVRFLIKHLLNISFFKQNKQVHLDKFFF